MPICQFDGEQSSVSAPSHPNCSSKNPVSGCKEKMVAGPNRVRIPLLHHDNCKPKPFGAIHHLLPREIHDCAPNLTSLASALPHFSRELSQRSAFSGWIGVHVVLIKRFNSGDFARAEL
jgi:hypothetical protein